MRMRIMRGRGPRARALALRGGPAHALLDYDGLVKINQRPRGRCRLHEAHCARALTLVLAVFAHTGGSMDLFDFADAPVKHQFCSEERWDLGADESLDGGRSDYIYQVSVVMRRVCCVECVYPAHCRSQSWASPFLSPDTHHVRNSLCILAPAVGALATLTGGVITNTACCGL